MFCVKDTVMYGNSGVCEIVDIRSEKFDKQEATYYVLKPLDNTASTIYCPVDNQKVKMRRLLSVPEIYELIQTMPDTEGQWIENDQQRKEKFSEIIRRGDHRELVQLIKTLYDKRQEKQRMGRKFHVADEKAMKEAEYILYGEFAHVLSIKLDEVVPFIMGQLNKEGARANESQ